MPTPPSFTQAFNGVGNGGVYPTWGKLRTVLYTGDYPGYEYGGSNVHYLSGVQTNQSKYIRSQNTPTMVFGQPFLKTIDDGGNYYILASTGDIEEPAKTAIIGAVAVFNSTDYDTVTTDAFAGYPGQPLSVTLDPNFIYSLSGWTRVT